MIKKYFQFIKEKFNNNFNTIGEWVESLMEDEYVRNIIARYTKETDPSIRLANTIDILDEKAKDDIKYQIDEYLKNGIVDKDPEIIASTDLEEIKESEITLAGKGIFSSFLKSLTNLGQKELKASWEHCPNNFLIFYYYKDLDASIVKQIFSRYRSLNNYLELIDYGKNETNLYYGIKTDGNFEYGVSYDKLIPMGQFRLSKSVIKWLCQIDSKSAFHLKTQIVNLSYNDILTLGKIKSDMETFVPGYHERKESIIINDKIITFGYYGLGKWENGKADEKEFTKMKNNFINWVLTKKWSDKVLISVPVPKSFTTYIHIKLK